MLIGNLITIVLYSILIDSILFDSISTQLSTYLCRVLCVKNSESWWVMRHDEFNSDQNTVTACSQSLNDCWCSVLTVLFFLSFCIARLLSIGCCITVWVEIAWFWFSQLGYCRSQCICECSYVTLNTVIFVSTNVVNRPLLRMISMIVVLPGHSPLLVRGDVSN